MTDYPSPGTVPHRLSAAEIAAMPEVKRTHPLNPKAVRQTKSISDALGLSHIGVHLVRIAPGDETTEFHLHQVEEEFIYILSGRGIAEIGEHQVEVNAGDFMAFTAPSLPHAMRNPFENDLVYLMGGNRQHFEICDYPHLQKRQFRHGDERHLVNWSDLTSNTPPQ
jgi:uncharacterized cupin superfamily protein